MIGLVDYDSTESENEVIEEQHDPETEVAGLHPEEAPQVQVCTPEDLESARQQQILQKNSLRRESSFTNQNKALRLSGKPYTGRTKVDGEKATVDKPPKRLSSPCPPNAKCRSGKGVFKCSNWPNEERQKVFTQFWEDLDWLSRKTLVRSLVDCVKPFRPSAEKSRVSTSHKYNLKRSDGKRERVCKKMFCTTFGIPLSTITKWLSEKSSPKAKKFPQRPGSKVVTSEQKRILREFLDHLHKMPSHYCRKQSDKLYLESKWRSIRNLYKRLKLIIIVHYYTN